MSDTKHKGFKLVVKEIQEMIKSEGLTSGDKLPSERYLSEKLNISRSSVREALRAMELLGVIHTRVGEGTFLSDMDDHQLFELIGGYLITSQTQSSEIKDFINAIEQYTLQNKTADKSIEEQLQSQNSIMYRVWKLLKRYDKLYTTGD